MFYVNIYLIKCHFGRVPNEQEGLITSHPPITGWFYTLHGLGLWILLLLLFLPASLCYTPLSVSTPGSRPFHLPTSHLAWKSRPAPSHALLICLTSLAMWLLYFPACLCTFVPHTLWSFFPLPVVTLPPLYPLSAVGPSLSLSLSVGQCQGVRRGQQLGMGMMGGVLIAVTAWRAWWQREWRPVRGRPSRATCSLEDCEPASESRIRRKHAHFSPCATEETHCHANVSPQQRLWLDEWIRLRRNKQSGQVRQGAKCNSGDEVSAWAEINVWAPGEDNNRYWSWITLTQTFSCTASCVDLQENMIYLCEELCCLQVYSTVLPKLQPRNCLTSHAIPQIM